MSSFNSIQVLNVDDDSDQRYDDYHDDSEQRYDDHNLQQQEVAVGICAGFINNDTTDADVTAEYTYPLASAAFINQLTDEDFLILSNIEDNDFNFGDIVFAQPIDDSIDTMQQSNSISLSFNGIATIRDALNSIDDDSNIWRIWLRGIEPRPHLGGVGVARASR
jgi:hypothetical protein